MVDHIFIALPDDFGDLALELFILCLLTLPDRLGSLFLTAIVALYLRFVLFDSARFQRKQKFITYLLELTRIDILFLK